jgi:hypothetical protein
LGAALGAHRLAGVLGQQHDGLAERLLVIDAEDPRRPPANATGAPPLPPNRADCRAALGTGRVARLRRQLPPRAAAVCHLIGGRGRGRNVRRGFAPTLGLGAKQTLDWARSDPEQQK